MDTILTRDDHATFEDGCTYQDFTQQLRHGRVIVILEHRRTDGGVESFFRSNGVVFAKEGKGVLTRHVFGVLRKRLSAYAQRLDFISRPLENRFGPAQG